MSRFRPSELMDFLRERGLAPKKGLSQNFLIDGNILKKIVKQASVQPGDLVLEVGPGPGALTEQLLLAGAEVLAVEKDRGFAEALPELADSHGHADKLKVYAEDILEVPLEKLFKSSLKEKKRAKVIANLPYHLTSPILARLVPLFPFISDLVVMVQDEVARRMVALPGSRDYGSFSVFLQFYCAQRSYAFKVGKRCFMPAPKVDSAVVHLSLQPPLLEEGEKDFLSMMRRAFQQKRKMLRRSLGEIYGADKVCTALDAIKLPQTTRPEDLDVHAFIALYQALGPFSPMQEEGCERAEKNDGESEK